MVRTGGTTYFQSRKTMTANPMSCPMKVDIRATALPCCHRHRTGGHLDPEHAAREPAPPGLHRGLQIGCHRARLLRQLLTGLLEHRRHLGVGPRPRVVDDLAPLGAGLVADVCRLTTCRSHHLQVVGIRGSP